MIVYSWFTYYKWFFYSYVKLPGGVYIYILVVWNMCILFPYIGNSDPNWLSSFQRGRYTTNQIYIYIYICAFFTSSILMGSSVNKWYSINYIYCWFFLILVDMKLLAEIVSFLGFGFVVVILVSPYASCSADSLLQVYNWFAAWVYIYRLYIYIYICIWKLLIPLLAMVFTIGFNGLYPPIAISRHCESWKSVIGRLKSWL